MRYVGIFAVLLLAVAVSGCDEEPQVMTWRPADPARAIPSLTGRWRIWFPLVGAEKNEHSQIIIAEVMIDKKKSTGPDGSGRFSYEGSFNTMLPERGEQKGEIAFQQNGREISFIARVAGIVSPTFQGKIINNGFAMWGKAASSDEYTSDTWLAQKFP